MTFNPWFHSSSPNRSDTTVFSRYIGDATAFSYYITGMNSERRGVTPSVFSRLGIAIGHATNEDGATGCTVVRGVTEPFRCAATVIGRASGSRELATCEPNHLVDRTDAIFLTGGSAYGLDATAGVMRWMEEHQRGFAVGAGVVPIVPAGVIFDLAPLGQFSARPTPEMAYAACHNATTENIAEGSVGAGTGALVGKAAGMEWAMKGGVGLGVAERDGVFAAALAVVNAFGDVRNAYGRIIAGARAPGGGFLDSEQLLRGSDAHADFARQTSTDSSPTFTAHPSAGRTNTTLVVAAISVPLSKAVLSQLASAASAALYRRITPCGTSFDGDILFAIAPVSRLAGTVAADGVPMARIEALAAAAVADAIERGVTTARGRDGIPGLADFSNSSTDV